MNLSIGEHRWFRIRVWSAGKTTFERFKIKLFDDEQALEKAAGEEVESDKS